MLLPRARYIDVALMSLVCGVCPMVTGAGRSDALLLMLMNGERFSQMEQRLARRLEHRCGEAYFPEKAFRRGQEVDNVC